MTPRLIVGALVLATVSTVYPGFLIAAVSVQVSDEFGVSEGTYGWALGSFFLAATAGSVLLGRAVQRVGPRRQITAALIVTALTQLGLAAFAHSFAAVLACLVVAGFMNAANQAAVNLALARADISRLGLAVAVKQSGMPAAALISGFTVPVLALTVGWRWGYVLGAAMAVVAVVGVQIMIEPDRHHATLGSPEVVTSMRTLWLAAVMAAFLAFGAGGLNAWVVASGVDAGLSEGMAGVMLGLGAGAGIACRLYGGLRSDTMRHRPFRVAGLTVFGGALGLALLATRVPAVHVGATVVAFAGGWVWPVFTNFGIVRSNPAAAGAATGITQMGVYVGVFSAPLVTGWLIDTSGYEVMWLVVAASAVVGAVIALAIADEF